LPDPKKFKDKQDFMSVCMHQVKTIEGEPQDVAVSKCLGQWNSKGKKKSASDKIRDLSKELLSL
jgi:hypothetical protein